MPPLQIGLVQTGPKLGPEGGRPLEYHLERMGLLMVSDHSCSYTVYQRNNSLKTTPGGLLFSPHYGPSLRWYMSWLPNISSCHLFCTRQHHHTVIGVYGTHANTYIYTISFLWTWSPVWKQVPRNIFILISLTSRRPPAHRKVVPELIPMPRSLIQSHV